MSKDKKMKNVRGSGIMDPNNEHEDYEGNKRAGKNKSVVMLGGVPHMIGGDSDLPEETEEETEQKEADKMLDESRTVRVTKLPDDMGMENDEKEEVVLSDKKSVEGPLKNKNKEIKRAEVKETKSKKKTGKPKKK